MTDPIRTGAVLYAKDTRRLAGFYADVGGLPVVHEAHDHIVLEARGFQLVVHALPAEVAATITPGEPPARRDGTPVKLVFVVPSLAEARRRAVSRGGALAAPQQEWLLGGGQACEGVDPEGNVVQFRAEAAPPPPRLAAVRLFVDALEPARAFYAGVLGLVPMRDGSAAGFCVFRSHGIDLIVESVAADAPATDRALVGRFSGVSFAVPDIDAEVRRLTAAGVVFSAAPERQAWGGTLATLRDPAGNELQIVQYPA